jgi:hypothetical protein
MDITRNWRLKMSRTQMFAARSPETGVLILPQQTSFAAHAASVQLYDFSHEEAEPLPLAEFARGYADVAAH